MLEIDQQQKLILLHQLTLVGSTVVGFCDGGIVGGTGGGPLGLIVAFSASKASLHTQQFSLGVLPLSPLAP